MTALVGVPVAESGPAGDLGEPPVEVVAGVLTAVRVAEHEVVVLPVVARGEPFCSLGFPVCSQGGYRVLG